MVGGRLEFSGGFDGGFYGGVTVLSAGGVRWGFWRRGGRDWIDLWGSESLR